MPMRIAQCTGLRIVPWASHDSAAMCVYTGPGVCDRHVLTCIVGVVWCKDVPGGGANSCDVARARQSSGQLA